MRTRHAVPLLALSLVIGSASSSSAAIEHLHAVTEDGRLLRLAGVSEGPIAKLEMETAWTFSDVAVDTHGRIIAAGEFGGATMLVELAPDTGTATTIGPTDSLLLAITFDGSGRLWGLGADQVLRRYHPTTGEALTSLPLNAAPAAEAFALGDDGTLYLATATALLTIDTESGDVEPIGSFQLPGVALGVRGIGFDAKGELVAVADGFYAPALLFEVDRNTGAATLVGPIEATAGASVRGIAFETSPGVGTPGQGLGEHHDLILSWVPGTGGGGLLIGSNAAAYSPGMFVAGLDPAQVPVGGFSFLVDPASAVLVPVALSGDGSIAVPVAAAHLSATNGIFVQLLSVEAGVIHASNRAELLGGLSAGQS